MGMRALFKAASAAVATFMLGSALSVSAFAETLKEGQPTDKAMGWQPAATLFKVKVEHFYDHILFPIITIISLLVLVLLAWIVFRYNKKSNPVAARFSHNTLVEIIWTLGPVVILIVIAIFSLSLLKYENDMPTPDVVVKATGNQWFWTYDYPELGVTDVESRILPDALDLKKAKDANIPYLLEVDNKLVVPVNRVVHVEVTGADVIHSFTVPAFGIKIDAVPGRLNNTWFKATRIGTYYGQCSELCGKDHAYMPIEVQVVSDADFDAYVIKAGGKTRAMLAADASAAAAAASASASEAANASIAAAATPADTAAGAPSASASGSAVAPAADAGPSAATGTKSSASAAAAAPAK